MTKQKPTFADDLKEGTSRSHAYQTRHSGKDVLYIVKDFQPEHQPNNVVIAVYDINGRLMTPIMAVPAANLSSHERAPKELSDRLIP